MNFSAWSIRNPVAPLLAFFLFLLLGYQSFNALPITRFPNIDVPLVSVTVAQSGAAPVEMETQITKEIEDAVAGITGVKNVTSSVTDGLSTTAVEFQMEVPTEQAVQDVKDAVDQIRGDLPGDIEAPIVTRIDVEGGAILTYAVQAPNLTMEEISWFVDDTVTRSLQGRPGIGRVTRIGGADREIRVELDPVKLDSYGVTAQQVSEQIAATNTNLGAGKISLGTGEQAIRTLGDSGTVEDLAAMPLALPSGRFVRLSDLGKVVDGYEELRSFARVDGNSTVSFLVFRAKGASEVSVAELTREVIEGLREEHPDVSITLVDDAVFYTEGNYEAAIDTLLEGALLAVIVVMLFLRNWRATLITAVALPLSAVPTFWLMDMLGFSLNLVSFLALTLATGILVDDAIVEIENIQRHIRMGKTPYRAAIDAADEIGLAVIATTFTIVAVFVPVSFMPGIPGQYFMQFGLTVAISVLFSLMVARLITPMMAAYFLRTKDAGGHEHGADGVVMRWYLWFVALSTSKAIGYRPRRRRGSQSLNGEVSSFSWRRAAAPFGSVVAAAIGVAWGIGIFGAFFSVPIDLLFVQLGFDPVSQYLVNPLSQYVDLKWQVGLFLVGVILSPIGQVSPHYYITVSVAAYAVFISVILLFGVPGSLFPPEDESRITASVELPPGSTLEDTDRTTEAMRLAVKDIDGVKSVLVVGGSTPLGERDIRRATFTIILDRNDNGLGRKFSDLMQKIPLIGPFLPEAPIKGRIRPQPEIEEEVFATLRAVPDVRSFKVGGPGGGSRPFSFDVFSASQEDLDLALEKIEAALLENETLLNPASEASLPRPEIQITPRAEEAARLGVTVQQIASVVRVATIGDVSAALGKLSIDNRLVPIRVQLDEASRDNLARIAALKVQTPVGPVPLSTVATIAVDDGPSVVERLNRERVATIGADIAAGYVLDQATESFLAVLPGLNLPASVTVKPSGDAEVQAELLGSFVNAMVLGVILMMFVLILLFRSVFQPMTIIFSLLLSVGGVAAALIITQNPLSMPVLIGILMLMGIVAKNAILLIDFAIEMRARGLERLAAVVEAGHKRAQPIVMTSIAMSAGMLPSALGVGEGGAFRAPMAIAVMGGIIVSTVLSLVVVPSLYLVMDDISRVFGWIFGRVIGQKESEPESPEAHVLAERIAKGREDLSLMQGRLIALEAALQQKGRPHAAE